MSHWLTYIINPEAVKSAFGIHLPSLDLVRLEELQFSGFGPEIRLRFDLRTYPVEPPKRWVAQGFNQVQATLHAANVYDVKLDWNGRALLCAMNIYKRDELIHVEVISEDINLSFKADFLSLSKFDAYMSTKEGAAWRL